MAHILVVDDDDGFREGLVETLIDLGHEVDEASSGEQALDILTHAVASYTCMFLDFRLPGFAARGRRGRGKAKVAHTHR